MWKTKTMTLKERFNVKMELKMMFRALELVCANTRQTAFMLVQVLCVCDILHSVFSPVRLSLWC